MNEGVNPTEPVTTWPADDEVVRAFFAVQIDDATRRNLVRIQNTLKRTQARVAWVAPRNLHLTMVFLGDTFGAVLRRISAALVPTVAALAPFELKVEGLCAFGPPGRPRVFWAGVPAPATALLDLQRRTA